MGALTDKAGTVVTAFANFATAFNAAVAKKRANASLADSSMRVEGKLDTDFTAETTAAVAAHKANGNHNVTPTQLNAYNNAEMTALAATYPEVASLPFVSFGDMSKVPIDVSGAFSGASDGALLEYAMNLEDDGTLVLLRNGTDGSKYRTYYAYLPNASAGASFTKLIRSTKEFRPTSVPSDKDIGYIFGSNNVMVMARLVNKNDPAYGDYALFMPNGSLLKDDLPSVFVTAANWNTNLQYRDAVIVGQYVYFFGIANPGGQSALDIQVFRIPLTSFNGGYVVPERLTNWTMNTAKRTGVVTTDIRLFDKLYSTNQADDSVVWVDNSRGSSFSSINIFHNQQSLLTAQKDDRYIRVRSIAYTYFAYAALGQASGLYTSFSFVIDLQTKTVTMDPCGTGQETFTTGYYPDGKYNYTATGYFKYTKQNVLGGFLGNTYHDIGILQKPGHVFSVTANAESDANRAIYRAAIVGAADSSFFEGIKYGATLSYTASLSFSPVYGSALGSKFYGLIPFSDYGYFVGTYGRNAAGNAILNIARVINDASQPEYQHKRTNGSVVPGYGPSTDRKFLSDEMTAANATMYSFLVSEVDDVDGYTVHGSYFVSDLGNTGLGDIDSTGREVSPGSRVNINATIYDQIWAAVSAQYPTETTAPSSRSFGVFFPKKLPRSYGYVMWHNSVTKFTYMALVEFKVNGGTLATSVSSIAINSVSSLIALTTTNGSGVSNWYPTNCGGITIYKVGTEGYAIGFTTKSQYGFVGGAGSVVVRFFVNNFSDRETQVGDWTSVAATSVYPYLANNFGYTALKGYGFGTYNAADSYTKMIFSPFVKTKAGFNAVTYSGTSRVLATQELAQGWDVYFTNANRVMMAGKIYDIPATSINLKTIDANPQNKTFYVYLKYSNGVVTYDIRNTRGVESYAYIQIGTITTGANSIANISISKIAMAGGLVKDNV